MSGLLKSFTRVSSFVAKELIEVVRRPGAFVSLILGPFLVMAIFGAGYTGTRRPMETVVVIPEGSSLSREAAEYEKVAGPTIRIVEVTSDLASAEDRLRRQQIDLVVVAPPDVEQALREGRQSQLEVRYNQVDPVLTSYASFLAYRLSQEVNAEILRRAVEEGQRYAVKLAGQPEAAQIPPDLVARPTTVETVNISPTPAAVLPFFAPAVVALIIQHMAVTLTALSLVRERLSGAFELFRVAPVSVREILVGKYLGFGLLTGLVAGALLALLMGVFGVPLLGDPLLLLAAAALLTFTSLGLGLLISVVADSERQAVQLSLLVLLASVFFSGLVLPIEEFAVPVRAASHLLPVTNGIRLFQDVMLMGVTYRPYHLLVLALVGLALFVITALQLRRSMARG
ncbi:MAG TPA: ABC transporter permease [Candidatus Limnocylindrales bacterium]|nr:ABC transporter permease [Candidatus Limnocylindrales bacterium]